MQQAAFLVALILLFSVCPLYSQSDSISGLVVASDGTPLAGIPVKALPDGTNSTGLPTITTKTDDSGRYHLEGVPYGTYTLNAGPDGSTGTTLHAIIETSLRVSLSRFGIDPITGNRTPSTTRTQTIPIFIGPARVTVPESATPGFDLVVLSSAFTVSGHLVVPENMALPKMRASLKSSVSELTIRTDVHPDGKFEISNVPPGTYLLRIAPNLGIPPKTITVTDQNQSDIELGGKNSGVRVSGTVSTSDRTPYTDAFAKWVYLVGRYAKEIESITQIQIFRTLFSPNPDSPPVQEPQPISYADEFGNTIEAPLAPVGIDGRFEFLTVPKGDYFIRTFPEMGIPNSPLSVKDADLTDVRAGKGVRVRGELISLNAGMQPPELIRLTAVEFKGESVSADVKADGSFEFPRVGPGTYQVLLDNKIRPRPSEVTVGEDDLIFRVETPFNAWVTGRVVFAGQIPPPDVLAGLRVGMNNGYDSEVKPDGSFRIKSNEGEYEFFLKNLPEECVLKSITDGIGNLMIEPVKVELSSPPREVLVTLEYKPAPVK
jgi:hypothetical protein